MSILKVICVLVRNLIINRSILIVENFALRQQLAFWDEVKTHGFVVEPGLFDIMVGGSSADIRAKAQLEVISPR